MQKRAFLKTIGLFSAGAALLSFNTKEDEADIPFTTANQPLIDGKFTLPTLPYAYDALEGEIDKTTMEIHHGKHHKSYVDNLNANLSSHKKSFETLEELLQQLNKKSIPLVRNNAGGHWNHSFFWETLSPNKGQTPGPKTMAAITTEFGDMDKFKLNFSQAAISVFGSGWAWLMKLNNGKLAIVKTPNQDNPLMKKLVPLNGTPLIGIDVWEHAYYLKYQNKRADYVKSFFNIINWAKVEERMS